MGYHSIPFPVASIVFYLEKKQRIVYIAFSPYLYVHIFLCIKKPNSGETPNRKERPMTKRKSRFSRVFNSLDWEAAISWSVSIRPWMYSFERRSPQSSAAVALCLDQWWSHLVHSTWSSPRDCPREISYDLLNDLCRQKKTKRETNASLSTFNLPRTPAMKVKIWLLSVRERQGLVQKRSRAKSICSFYKQGKSVRSTRRGEKIFTLSFKSGRIGEVFCSFSCSKVLFIGRPYVLSVNVWWWP